MNSAVFWYPLLQDLRIPTPKTIFIHLDDGGRRLLSEYVLPPKADRFLRELKEALEIVGFPAFLRTENCSDKHNWTKTCFIEKRDDNLEAHLFALAEHSELADIERGDLYHFWMVREMIQTERVFTAFEGNMPIVSEIRYFVRNGKIECKHHYWPEEVFDKSDNPDYKKLVDIPQEEISELDKMAQYISCFFTGYWSVDFLRSKDKEWYCADMGLGERSYHQKHLKPQLDPSLTSA